MKLISQLPKHPTEIYVLGTGSSLNFINKDFWNNKVTIGINLIYKYLPVKYALAQHTSLIRGMVESGITAIAPEYDMGMYRRPRFDAPDSDLLGVPRKYYIYKHFNNFLYDFPNNKGYLEIDFSDFDNPETLVAGTTTATAIHLAYKLGAKSIILVGLDAGYIDGELHIKGYNPPDAIQYQFQHLIDSQPQIDLICNEIRKRGVGVYSINPFNNFRNENHEYKSF
jgi:hypothetical protein